jgi:hypothetical protein
MRSWMAVSVFAAILGWVGLSLAGRDFVPKGGFVPTANVAVQIAEAVSIPIYGEKQIVSQRPLKAKLQGGVWTVEGTFPFSGEAAGGVVEIQISKRDGRILSVTHGR